MSILGEQWGSMSEEEQAPFIQLAKEESAQHDREKALLEKAQKPNEVWQPIRRCKMVLEKIKADGFATIFLEPVNLNDFPDYEDFVDIPMDLGTVTTKINSKKYMAPEQFARDVRKVRFIFIFIFVLAWFMYFLAALVLVSLLTSFVAPAVMKHLY